MKEEDKREVWLVMKRGVGLLVLGYAVYFVFTACGGGGGPGPIAPSNTPPVITGLTMNPAILGPGGLTHLTATAVDGDNDALSYSWAATGGVFDNGSGIFINAGATVSWTAPSTPGVSYTITVTVSDGKANGTVQKSITINISTLVVSIDSPAPSSVVGGRVPITGHVLTFLSPATFQPFLDSQTLTLEMGETNAVNSDGSFSFTWDTRKTTDGPHAIGVRVTDAALNFGSTQITLKVDNTSPSTIYFLKPASGIQITNATNSPLEVEVAAFDPSISEVHFFYDIADENHKLICENSTAVPKDNVDRDGTDSWICLWDFKKPPFDQPQMSGPHTLIARAFDRAGNALLTDSTVSFFLLNCGTSLSANIGNRTLTQSESPYFITNDITITGTVSTTGNVRIKFLQGKKLTVSGRLNTSAGAVFTSVAEGYCLENAGASSPGDWGNITFQPGSSGNLSKTVFEYGGGNTGEMIDIQSNNVVISESIIRNSASAGVRAASTAIGSRIEKNTFQQNGTYPVTMDPSFSGLASDNVFLGNRTQAIRVEGGTISVPTEWKALGIPYAVQGTLVLSTGGQLSVGDGAIVKLNSDVGIALNGGALNATDVVFTSLWDDRFGGDTNGDGLTGVPPDRHWSQIFFGAGSTGRLQGAQLFFAGGGGAEAALEIFSSSPTVVDSSIVDSAASGVKFSGSSTTLRPTFTGNTISRSQAFPVIIPPFYSIPAGNNIMPDNTNKAIAVLKGDVLEQVGLVTWNPLTFPYVILDSVRVAKGGHLQLAPGVIVKFQRSTGNFQVEGQLDADGVLFTSFADDAGADSDGVAQTPRPGDWSGLFFRPDSTGNFTSTSILYAGGSGASAAVDIDSASPSFGNCTIAFSATDGIRLHGDPAKLTPTLNNNNTIRDNGGYPITMPPYFSLPVPSTNTYVRNKFQGIQISGATPAEFTVPAPLSVIWDVQPLPYVISQEIGIAPSAQLTLRSDPSNSLVVKFGGSSAGFRVLGNLVADAAGASPIVFTSMKDDSRGGDTNGDLTATTPSAGDWKGIFFDADGAGRLKGVQIYYAGLPDTSSAPFSNGAIRVLSSSPAIDSVLISDSASAAIVVDRNGDPVKTNPVIRNSTFSGILSFPLVIPPFYLRTGSGLENTNTFVASGAGKNRYNAVAIYPGPIPSTFPVAIWGVMNSLDTGAVIPYVPLGIISVAQGVELRLMENVLIKFFDQQPFGENPGLVVDGVLTSLGTRQSRNIFTSFKDDASGGDTNGDGVASSPAPGDWGSILIRTQLSGTLSNVRILYGGGGGARGALIFQGPSLPTSLYVLLGAVVQYSKTNGIFGENQFNLEISESNILNNTTNGMEIRNSPLRVLKTESAFNGQRGIYVVTQVLVHLDAIFVHDNGANGVEVEGSRPTIVNSFLNPVFPHRVAHNGTASPQPTSLCGVQDPIGMRMGVYLHNPERFQIDELTVENNANHGIFVCIDNNPTTPIFSQITDSISRNNGGDGLRFRNQETGGVISIVNVLITTVDNFVSVDNAGSGVYIYQASPTLQRISMVRNHRNGLFIDYDEAYVMGDIEADITNPDNLSLRPGALSIVSRVKMDLTSPAVGLGAPATPPPGACATALPVANDYNCYADNDPYPILMPPFITLNPGNFFQPTPVANPNTLNIIRLTRGVIYDRNPESLDPTNPDSYDMQPDATGYDTWWRSFENDIVYVVGDDLLILQEDADAALGRVNHPTADGLQSRVILRITDTVVKFLTTPENPGYSKEAIDIQVHSTLRASNTVFTSIRDDSFNGDSDGVSGMPLPGDWGAIRFHEDSRDWYDSLRSADNDEDPEPCAFVPGTLFVCRLGVDNYDAVSDLLNSQVLYGGSNIEGAIYIVNASPYIHATQPGASRIAFSATNGVYANGSGLPTPFALAVNSDPVDWSFLGYWPCCDPTDPANFLQNYAWPQINNTIFESNNIYGGFLEKGASAFNIDGIQNFAGSNTFTGNTHDCFFIEGTPPVCP